MIYLFPINLHVGLIEHIKSRPHFIKGSSRSVVTNLAKLFVLSPLIFWHLTQLLQNSCISFNRISRQYPTFKIFFIVIYATKCPPTIPSCNSLRTICVSKVVKHLRILLSCPNLYIIPSFRIKGSTFLAKFYFWVKLKVYGI